MIKMPEVDSRELVTLHKSTAAQEHRLLGKLQTLEGTINKATGLVRGGMACSERAAVTPGVLSGHSYMLSLVVGGDLSPTGTSRPAI